MQEHSNNSKKTNSNYYDSHQNNDSAISEFRHQDEENKIAIKFERLQQLRTKRFNAIKKAYPSIKSLNDRDLQIYIDMYTIALEDKESSLLTLAVCGIVICTTGMVFFNAWRSRFVIPKFED